MFTPDVFPRGCRGGNLIKVGHYNLHSVWVRLLPFEETIGGVGSAAVKIVEEAGQNGPDAAKRLEPKVWLMESLEVAQTAVFDSNIRAAIKSATSTDEVRVSISVEYRKNAGHLARRRALQAGYRLAEIPKMKTKPNREDAGPVCRIPMRSPIPMQLAK